LPGTPELPPQQERTLGGVLHIHRSERADYLVGSLGELLSQPLSDPMVPEVVAVPTQGVERWLSQRLAHKLGASAAGSDGACANIEWPSPGELVAMAGAACTGVGTGMGRGGWWSPTRAGDPWSPERLVWPLLQLVDEHLDDPFMAPLAGHLRASSPGVAGARPRRFSAVRHVAQLFYRYGVERPEMLLDWLEAGVAEAGVAEAGAGMGGAGAADRRQDVAWQSELWRRLRRKVAVPSPAERLGYVSSRLAAEPQLLDLPERISCFGLTRLPASHLVVLKAIAVHREVHLFLLHPSGALWDKIAVAEPRSPARTPRADDATAEVPASSLLRSWGRDAREMQLVLASAGVGDGEHRPVPSAAGPSGATLLGLLQADIRADRQPPGPPKPEGGDHRSVLAGDDDSLRIHSCHGRARQVEVVREAVLHLLADDPTLEPRDVIVMCPDIELFAPLVSASFGVAGMAGAPALRARLADRSLRQTNPLLAVAAHLLDMAGGRATATEVLDFVSRDPVRRRFGFDEAALVQIERWLVGTGVRWGFDAAHRAAWKLDGLETATWRAGTDRLLLGVAMADEGALFGGMLPYGDLSSSEIELAGRLAELVERLRSSVARLGVAQTVESWAQALTEETMKLACPAPGEVWQEEQLRRTFDEVAALAAPWRSRGAGEVEGIGAAGGTGAAGCGSPELDLAEARALLEDRLRGRPTRANFCTGDMTICTLAPMRSVPHRVVCLIGLDDGLFPRPADHDGDDLLLANPMVGDRDGPSEDRQLLLDALLAATEHLVITYEGHDLHLNQKRAPAVPVVELLDVIDATVRLEDPSRPAREVVVVDHPLQAFDWRNFSPGALGVDGPWRFDQAQLDGARALATQRRQRPGFLPARLPPRESATLQLASLVRFVEHPVRAFLRDRLGFYAGDVPEPISGSLPLELSPLERWALGDRLLSATLDGASLESAVAAEIGRGLLPPRGLGDEALAEVWAVVEALLAEVGRQPCAKAPASPVEINIALRDGRALVGTVPRAHDGVILRCTFSKLGAKHRLRAWAQLLALSAAHPELVPSAVTIGQAEGSTPRRCRLATQTLHPLGDSAEAIRSAALGMLSVLVDLFDRGMREPLPIYSATSAAWARSAAAGENPFVSAQRRWTSSFDERMGESAEPEHVAVLGGPVDFEQLLVQPPRADESGTGWASAERSRFGRLALRLWEPVLSHESLRER